MSTLVFASAVVPADVDRVWAFLRRFSFPQRAFAGQSVEIESGAEDQVGCVRKLTWDASAQWQRHRLLAVDDIERRVSYELVEEWPASEVSACITTVSLRRVTDCNHTYVKWECATSAGATASYLKFLSAALQQNLRDVRAAVGADPVPVVHHVVDGPSSRVIWLATELAVPLDVRVQEADVAAQYSFEADGLEMSLHTSAEVAMFQPAGSLMPRFQHGALELIESGAILHYMLARWDAACRLHPPHTAPAAARAVFQQWLFFAAATLDPLLIESYMHMHALPWAQRDPSLVAKNRAKWEVAVRQRLEPALAAHRHICGERFSAADVMLGHTVHFAHTLGWVEDASPVAAYHARLLRRPGFYAAYVASAQD